MTITCRTITAYRRESLTTDGAAIRTIANRLEMLLTELRLEARLASDGDTGEAMELLANELRDAAHGAFSAMLAAHDAACDALGMESAYTPDAGACLALGLPVTSEPAREELSAAVAEIGARFTQ